MSDFYYKKPKGSNFQTCKSFTSLWYFVEFTHFSKTLSNLCIHNSIAGEANVAADEKIGYSGEDVPTDAPKNFALDEVSTVTQI